MQIRNNYDKEVFNGDIGVITSIDLEDRCLLIDYDGRSVEYDVTELDEVVLAYHISKWSIIFATFGIRCSLMSLS